MATVVATAGVVAATELLSVVAWLGRPGVLAFWSGAAALAALWLFRGSEQQRCRQRLPELQRGIGQAWAVGRLELVGLAIVLATVLLVGLVSPPSYPVSMANGMMRVAIWLQQGSLAAYATPWLAQISQPPLVSYQIAQLTSLGGGDWVASVPEWLALAGCSLVASLLARALGQSLRVQLLAAVIAATLPMGLLQGSSTQGNLLAAYWVLCFVLLLAQHLRSPALWRLVCCGLAAGFALLAASTAFVVLPAVAVVLGLYGGVACRRPRHALLALAAAAALALVVNFGHFARNAQVFDHPVAPIFAGETNDQLDLTVLTSNLMRNSLVHWSLPNAAFGEWVLDAVSALVGGIPEPPAATAGATLEQSRLPHRIKETETPNFLHHWLLVIAAIGLLTHLARGRAASPPLLVCLLAGWLASIVAFAAVLQWQFGNSRQQVALFMLGAPLAAVFLTRALEGSRLPVGSERASESSWRLRTVSVGLLIASAPWLLFKESAPLLPNPVAAAPTTSIFARPRAEGYFSHLGGRAAYQSHVTLADQLVALRPDEVGLDFGLPWARTSYPLVALVKERHKETRFAYFGMDAGNPTRVFEPDRRPDVIVKAGEPRPWTRFERVWTHPDGRTVLRRRLPGPRFRVLRPRQISRRWSREIEAGICEAALGPGGAGAFLQDDLLIYLGVRRPNASGERPPAVELGSAPLVGHQFRASLQSLGRFRSMRADPIPAMWERRSDGGAWTVLTNDGAANVYTPKPADVAARLRVTKVSDCGGRRWQHTSPPSVPVALATEYAATRAPTRPRRLGQVVVRAEWRVAHAVEGGQELERHEIVVGRRQERSIWRGFIAIRLEPERLLRLHITDVAANGRVLWQGSLPIPTQRPKPTGSPEPAVTGAAPQWESSAS